MLDAVINSNFLGNQGGTGEPQRVNSILLIIPDDGGSEIQLALQQFVMPKPFGQQNAVMIQRGLVAKKFAGNLSFDPLNLELKDYVDRPAVARLFAWRAQVFNAITYQVRAAAFYKRDCTVRLIGPEGTRNRSLLMRGAWPALVDYGNADVASDETTNIQVQLEYDTCVPGDGFNDDSLLLTAGITFAAGAATNALSGAL